ncbi:hypothetical protein K474DRAFT_1654909 [Panus rudis PR-1116 ss-1]|nr:hypothetical protein K474DRAFT_1654909 [Panus rudis PR-1116 ss-1]
MTGWDSTRAKNLMRLTAQRLGQIQYKLDSQGQITRRDIATLLSQGNVALARAKAQKLVREDIYGDVMQMLEMYLGVLSEKIGELEQNATPSPAVVEAASSVIYAAPLTESRDLQLASDMLIQRLGPDFARSAITNRENYVSPRVVRALNARPPPAAWMDQYLYSIAKAHGVKWKPDLLPHEKMNAIAEMLDPSSEPEVDMRRLRSLCSYGLPQEPEWIRPRVWRLLLGSIPPRKAAWADESRKQRDNYYDLVRRLLEPFTTLPPPTQPPSPLDASLLDASKELSQVPPGLLSMLEEEPDASETCPLDSTAPDTIRIDCADALDNRLRLIKESESKDEEPAHDTVPEIRLEGTPEIRLEAPNSPAEDKNSEANETPQTKPEEESKSEMHLDLSDLGTPEISLSAPETPTSTHSSAPTTLLASRAYSAAGAHPKHASALLRLLYIHWALNPANRAPQIASLLVPLYTALVQEVEPQDLAHAEADAFWLFETMISEFADLEDVETCNMWLRKLGERVSWADTDLAENLQTKGLDPALPHYSYRWLTPLLTHTLPLPAVFTVWDALFSRPMRERDSNPKLDYLVDMCTSMLLSARTALMRLGKRHSKSGNLWVEWPLPIPYEDYDARELDDAFVEGMALLRDYPLKNVGGIENIIQLAHDLAQRRAMEQQYAAPANAGIGARLKNTMWRSFASQGTIAEDTEEGETSESSEEEHHPEPVNNGSTLSSRLANTVWKGITNQSAMDVPPSPISPSPVDRPSTPVSATSSLNPPSSAPAALPAVASSKLWNYAEKLRDSDAAATFAKVSTNFRVKALDAWNNRGTVSAPNTPAANLTALPARHHLSPNDSSRRGGSLSHISSPRQADDVKRNSLPAPDVEGYSPPPRPSFFRPVRDSWMPEMKTSPTGSETSASDAGEGYPEKRRPSLASFVGLGGEEKPHATPKSGPRPLLLNSKTLITNHSPSPTSAISEKQWVDSVRAKRPSPSHRHSQSSLSSSSPADSLSIPRRAETFVPEVPSRVVPINRRSVSPMVRGRRQESTSSTASDPPTHHRRIPTEVDVQAAERKGRNGWAQADGPDSSTTLPSPPPPKTPVSARTNINSSVRVQSTETQRGSVVLAEPPELESDTPSEEVYNVNKVRSAATSLSRFQASSVNNDDTSDSSTNIVRTPTRSARVKSKRLPPRLATLRTRDVNSKNGSGNGTTPVSTTTDGRAPSPNTLGVEWPEEGDAVTPKAATFDKDVVASPASPRRRVRKVSGDKNGSSEEVARRTRKISTEGRTRKVSAESKHKRESAAVEGDDEGYDDLLSAYESEDGPGSR